MYWHNTQPRLLQHEHPHDPYFRGLVRLHREEGALRARIERAVGAQTARRATSVRDRAPSDLAAGRDSSGPLAMRTGARKGADPEGESSELLASSGSEGSLGGSQRDDEGEQCAGRILQLPREAQVLAERNLLTRSRRSHSPRGRSDATASPFPDERSARTPLFFPADWSASCG